MGFYTMKMGRSGFLYNGNGSEWFFIQRKWVGVGFYTIQMGWSGSEWLGA